MRVGEPALPRSAPLTPPLRRNGPGFGLCALIVTLLVGVHPAAALYCLVDNATVRMAYSDRSVTLTVWGNDATEDACRAFGSSVDVNLSFGEVSFARSFGGVDLTGRQDFVLSCDLAPERCDELFSSALGINYQIRRRGEEGGADGEDYLLVGSSARRVSTENFRYDSCWSRAVMLFNTGPALDTGVCALVTPNSCDLPEEANVRLTLTLSAGRTIDLSLQNAYADYQEDFRSVIQAFGIGGSVPADAKRSWRADLVHSPENLYFANKPYDYSQTTLMCYFCATYFRNDPEQLQECENTLHDALTYTYTRLSLQVTSFIGTIVPGSSLPVTSQTIAPSRLSLSYFECFDTASFEIYQDRISVLPVLTDGVRCTVPQEAASLTLWMGLTNDLSSGEGAEISLSLSRDIVDFTFARPRRYWMLCHDANCLGTLGKLLTTNYGDIENGAISVAMGVRMTGFSGQYVDDIVFPITQVSASCFGSGDAEFDGKSLRVRQNVNFQIEERCGEYTIRKDRVIKVVVYYNEHTSLESPTYTPYAQFMLEASYALGDTLELTCDDRLDDGSEMYKNLQCDQALSSIHQDVKTGHVLVEFVLYEDKASALAGVGGKDTMISTTYWNDKTGCWIALGVMLAALGVAAIAVVVCNVIRYKRYSLAASE